MGKTKIRISPLALASILQFPDGWQIVDGESRPLDFRPDSQEIYLTIEGVNVKDGVDYEAICHTYEDASGTRMTTIKWEQAAVYHGTLDDLRRTFNYPENTSESSN